MHCFLFCPPLEEAPRFIKAEEVFVPFSFSSLVATRHSIQRETNPAVILIDSLLFAEPALNEINGLRKTFFY